MVRLIKMFSVMVIVFICLFCLISCDVKKEEIVIKKEGKRYITITEKEKIYISIEERDPVKILFGEIDKTLTVLVNDSNGTAIENTRVDWEIIKGEGNLSKKSTITSNRSGYIGQTFTTLSVNMYNYDEVKVKASIFPSGESVVFTIQSLKKTYLDEIENK